MELATWLDQFPGGSWAQKWSASGAEDLGIEWWTLTGLKIHHGCRAAVTLMALRAVRPSYEWMAVARLKSSARRFQEVNELDDFARFHAAGGHHGLHYDARGAAVLTLVRIMITTGKAMADLTKEDFTHYIAAMRALNRPPSVHVTWLLLRDIGFLAGEEPSVQAAMAAGPPSVEAMVDRNNVACGPVRDLFVDYLKHRATTLDQNSLASVCYQLVNVFWSDLQAHDPEICSLHVSPEAAAAWKRRLQTRMTPTVYLSNLVAVRAFYLDIAEWALQEPGRWSRWAAPCPVRPHELKGHRKLSLKTTGRMHAPRGLWRRCFLCCAARHWPGGMKRRRCWPLLVPPERGRSSW